MNNDEMKSEWEKYNFPGYYKFYKILKEQKHDVLYKDIKTFVQRQKIYKEHTQTQKRQHGYIHSICKNFEFFADLIDYQRYESKNKHFKYILVVIDAYSRVAYVEAIKNKESKTVADAFEKILTESGTPQIVSSDNGSEFIGHEFKTMLTNHNITQSLSEVGDHFSLGLIDRFCRTIKSTIWKVFTKNGNRKWIDIYKDLVEKYNNTDNEGIGWIAPNETEKYPLNVYLAYMKKVGKTKKKNEKKIKYSVGDLVKKRIGKDTAFSKGYEPKWSKRTYTITGVEGRSYKIDDDTDKLYRQYDLLFVSSEDSDEEEADDEKEESEEEESEEDEDVDKHGEVSKLNIVKSKNVETTNGPRRTDRERKKNTKYTKDFV